MRATSSKQRIEQRRERNRQLAIRDAANRCQFCRRVLPMGFLTVLAADGAARKFCSDDCRDSQRERAQF